MNILLTSAGRRSYLVKYFKEAVSDGQVHAANSSTHSTAIQFSDRSVITPLIYAEDYIPFLLNYCQAHNIQAIVPLIDIDLPVLSRNKWRFEEIGVEVIVSNIDVIQVCNDKWQTYRFLIKHGFQTPMTFLSLAAAKRALENEEIHYPVIVKPRWGMGSILIFEAANEEELEVFYRKVKREISNTYIAFESQQTLEESVLIQEKIKGQEYGMDVINNLQGELESTVVKKKLAMRAGETDGAEIVRHETLKEVGEKLSANLKHIGNLDVDVFQHEDDVYILEMNARFGGGYPFSHAAGVHLPKAIIRWLEGDRFTENLLEAKPGVVAYKDINIVKHQFLEDEGGNMELDFNRRQCSNVSKVHE